SLPPNARLVLPEDSLSTYALMDAADVGLVFGSTAGIEFGMLAKPVVLSSRGQYEAVSQMHRATGPDDYFHALDAAIRQGPAPELRRQMYRFAYCLFYRMHLSLPMGATIYQPGFHYSSADELAPGRNPDLDRISAFLMTGAPIFTPPPASVS